MARTQNTLIGRASGSVGGVTFSTWKGINVIKQKPETVANPQTSGQTQQRSGMAQIVAVFRLISSAVNEGFKKLAVGMSAYNAFVKANLTSAFDYSTPGDALLVPENVLISKGSMTPTEITSIVADRSIGTALVSWDDTLIGVGQHGTDKLVSALYNTDLDAWIPGTGTRTRTNANEAIPLPADWIAGNNIRAYIGFTSVLTGDQSDSTNDTTAIVA